MRIAVASSGLGHVTRGIEAWASDLARAFHERGESLRLYKGGGSADLPYERVLPCLQRDSKRTETLMRLLPRRGSWRLGLGSPYAAEQTSFACSLVARLRREPVDILHVQDPLVAMMLQRARALGLIRNPTVLGHGTEEPHAFLRKITYLQQLAPHHLDEARRAGIWEPTWTAIPNFVNCEVFRPGRDDTLRAELGIPPEGLVVLTTAAIKRDHKRIDHLLDEFARLMSDRPALPAWRAVAGGRESDTDELIERGRAALGERVRFLVRYPRERISALYRAANIYVLCSLVEMMPIALIEAAASGLPCVIHRYPVCEWIAGSGGEVIDMTARGALTATLGILADDAGLRRILGEAARTHCESNFTRDRVVDRIVEYYHFVMQCDRREGSPGGAEATGSDTPRRCDASPESITTR